MVNSYKFHGTDNSALRKIQTVTLNVDEDELSVVDCTFAFIKLPLPLTDVFGVAIDKKHNFESFFKDSC